LELLCEEEEEEDCEIGRFWSCGEGLGDGIFIKIAGFLSTGFSFFVVSH